jgi:hypothetical protein
VGVGTEQGHLRLRKLVLIFQILKDREIEVAIDSHEIEPDQYRLGTGVILQHNRLGPEVDEGAIGRPVASGISRHPHRAFGSDLPAGQAGLPLGLSETRD